MLTKCSFDKKENVWKVKRACNENNQLQRKKMILLADEENKSYKEQDPCDICEGKFCTDEHDKNYKNRRKVKDHCHYTGKFRRATHSISNLNYKVPKYIPIIIHNASYDIDFIINQLAEEFKQTTHKLTFIDSFRFMPASLSDLVDNMSGIFNSLECKSRMEKIKFNSEFCFVGLKNNRLIQRCRECKEEWKWPIERLIKYFPSIYQFCSGDLDKLILLLRKGVHPDENMDNWEKFNETTLPP